MSHCWGDSLASLSYMTKRHFLHPSCSAPRPDYQTQYVEWLTASRTFSQNKGVCATPGRHWSQTWISPPMFVRTFHSAWERDVYVPEGISNGYWVQLRWVCCFYLNSMPLRCTLISTSCASLPCPAAHIWCPSALTCCPHPGPLHWALVPTPWASLLCPGAHTLWLSTVPWCSHCVSLYLAWCSHPGPLCHAHFSLPMSPCIALLFMPWTPLPCPAAHRTRPCPSCPQFCPFLALLLDLRGNNGSGDVIYQKNYFPVFHALYLSQKKSDQNLSFSGTLFNVNNLHNAGDYSILQTSEAFTRAYREAAILHTSWASDNGRPFPVQVPALGDRAFHPRSRRMMRGPNYVLNSRVHPGNQTQNWKLMVCLPRGPNNLRSVRKCVECCTCVI